MNPSSEKVIHYLTGHQSLDAVALEDLQKQVEENPYFPVSQFLLAKKLENEQQPALTEQLQKTALYFPNPYWLQYQLTNFTHKEKAINIDEDKTGTQPEGFVAEPRPAADTRATDVFSEKEPDQIPGIDPEQNNEEQPEIDQAEEESAVTTRDTDESAGKFLEEVSGEVKAPATTDLGLPTVEAMPMPEISSPEKLPVGSEETTGSADGKEMDEHERMFQNIKAMLDATSEEADADVQTTVVPIDPYYTIDYFASQGIKLDLDRPQDHLDKKVKKFTQWLKHMKKLGPEDATEAIYRTGAEADIQQIADTSNVAREVVTEAMAMVLEKQGKKEKAIELYNKLSFLNPHKSAYFADKIKNLKGT